MFCPKCGSEIAEGSAFCGKCGAPTGGPAGAAAPEGAGGAPAAGGGVPAPKKNGAKVGAIAAAVAVVVVLVTGLATNWFGLAGVQPKEAVEVPAASQPGASDEAQEGDGAQAGGQDAAGDAQGTDVAGGAAVKSAVEAYTWDELSQISAEIAAAGNEEAAVEVAKRYNLCTPEGRLDGTQVKSVTLSDGTQTTVQIVGFAHDDKTGGGKAGITFIFGDAIAKHSMNASNTNEGGWEDSEMRAYLNGEMMGALPDDLRAVIVPVDKLANNVGETGDASSVTTISDSLWLPSNVELCGPIRWPGVDCDYGDILNVEGSEYKLFRDTAVDSGDSNAILVRNLDGEPISWHERSATPFVYGCFLGVSSGEPSLYGPASDSSGVVPGFCI